VSLFAAQRVDPEPREPARKRAWEWTLEERLAQRLDPADIRERETVYREKYREQLKASSVRLHAERSNREGAIEYGIDGARNPELFLSHELFDSLLTGFTRDDSLRVKQRAFMQPKIRRFGFTDDELFWAQLTSVVGEYASLKYAPSSTRPSRIEVCRARHRALEAARQVFGRERFEEFLYMVIAPDKQTSVVTFGVDPATELRKDEAGCP
jgi:hypothetical protein